jgi:hypothetical protein
MNTEITTGYPSEVFGGDIVIANPATRELGAELDKQASKLPKKEQEAFLGTVMAKMWGSVEVIAAAKDCERFKAGDLVMGSPSTMKGATVTPDEKYLILSEKLFKGKW